ncbi:MAG: 16S rRNA (adenine(1518)-N(6)/adenine(1519)-N(6))-dimethyltransferase RsmA [Chthoniobacteraceae bacterium]
MKLSVIKSNLDELGVIPSKSLGQNFLHDQNLASWIVAQLELQPDDHLVEIGPGLGALTEFASPLCASVTVIEKDGRLAAFLRERFAGTNVEVHHQDAIDFDERELMDKGPLKIVGNLPYYVSSQILFKFITEFLPVSRMVFTLQKELAQRLSAQPATKDYGALTLLIQRRWSVKYLRNLPGTVFLPEPKVDSGVVLLTPRVAGELPDCDGEFFRLLVKQGFSQRRKQLRKMLSSHVSDWPTIAASLKISETARAEELSLRQWIDLTNLLRPLDSKTAQDVHGEMFDVVDEKDHVVRTASRHEVHTGKLLHRAVHIFVFNKAGELFLQKRSRWKDVHPSKWDSSAAGHVNSGDEFDTTAPRELEEELGVMAPLQFVGKINACDRTGQEFVHLYKAQHEGPFVLASSEIECGAFFPLSIVKHWTQARPGDFATGFLECLDLFIHKSAEAVV